MNIFVKSYIKAHYLAGKCSQGEALRLLTFHHNMSYTDALKYLHDRH